MSIQLQKKMKIKQPILYRNTVLLQSLMKDKLPWERTQPGLSKHFTTWQVLSNINIQFKVCFLGFLYKQVPNIIMLWLKCYMETFSQNRFVKCISLWVNVRSFSQVHHIVGWYICVYYSTFILILNGCFGTSSAYAPSIGEDIFKALVCQCLLLNSVEKEDVITENTPHNTQL